MNFAVIRYCLANRRENDGILDLISTVEVRSYSEEEIERKRNQHLGRECGKKMVSKCAAQ